jgi:hypothetical protein
LINGRDSTHMVIDKWYCFRDFIRTNMDSKRPYDSYAPFFLNIVNHFSVWVSHFFAATRGCQIPAGVRQKVVGFRPVVTPEVIKIRHQSSLEVSFGHHQPLPAVATFRTSRTLKNVFNWNLFSQKIILLSENILLQNKRNLNIDQG